MRGCVLKVCEKAYERVCERVGQRVLADYCVP